MNQPPPRQLLLLRHAKSAWPEGVADPDRPLRAKGERAARRIGRFLAGRDLRPGAAVASPARRAADTARLVLEAAGADVAVCLDDRLYGGDAHRALVEALAASPAAAPLLVVGHEPELVDLVGRLAGADVHLPTAGLAWLQLDDPATDRYPGRARLRLLVVPKMLDDG